MWNSSRDKCNNHTLETPGHKLVIEGSSIGGKNTSYSISNWWSCLLDCGIPSNKTPKNIFITHTHYDHIAGLVNTILNCIEAKVIPTIYCPQIMCDHLYNHINSAIRCTKNIPLDKEYYIPINICPVSVKPNENIFMIDMYDNKKKYCKIECIKCYHSTPTTGYGFTEVYLGLKKEHLDENGKCKYSPSEMSNFKINGEIENMQEWREKPLFCFLGDTNEKVLTDVITKYPVIIIECTFYKSDDIKKAKRDKHMHWIHLKKFIQNNPNNYFKLIHFSPKNTFEDFIKWQDEIDEYFPTSIDDTPHVYLMGNKAVNSEDSKEKCIIKSNNNLKRKTFNTSCTQTVNNKLCRYTSIYYKYNIPILILLFSILYCFIKI